MTEMVADPSSGAGGAEGTEIGRLFSRIVADPAFKKLLLTEPDTRYRATTSARPRS